MLQWIWIVYINNIFCGIGIIIVLIGSIVNRYDKCNIDGIFWTAVIVCFILIVFIMMIVNKISKKTKEIKDL